MNEYEREKFEHHKKEAEDQLNRMYYGTKGKSGNQNGGLTVPSFLAAPKHSKGKGNPQNPPNHAPKTPERPKQSENTFKKQSSPKNSTSYGGNILNLLNFNKLKIDNDRLIILAICLLLAGDEPDELLMLALIYIML